jgi:hypothetical protein
MFNASSIVGYGVEGSDGPIGIVADLLFEDVTWSGRWMAVDTGASLGGRRVLLPRLSLDRADRTLRRFQAHLTQREISDSPHIDAGMCVSRRLEADFCAHYGCQQYWADERSEIINGPTRLRSIAAVTNYRIHASDGEIGRVEDFVLEDVGWSIRHVAVKVRWSPDQSLLLSPRSALAVDWEDEIFHLHVTNCPPRPHARLSQMTVAA